MAYSTCRAQNVRKVIYSLFIRYKTSILEVFSCLEPCPETPLHGWSKALLTNVMPTGASSLRRNSRLRFDVFSNHAILPSLEVVE